jgi:predicted small secreted protein
MFKTVSTLAVLLLAGLLSACVTTEGKGKCCQEAMKESGKCCCDGMKTGGGMKGKMCDPAKMNGTK